MKKGNFTQIPNELIRCTKLNPFEKGILITLLSYPKTYKIHKEYVHKMVGCGVDKTDKAWKSLQREGYIISTKKIVSGRYQWEHKIFNTPQPVLQSVEKQSVEIPTLETQTIYKDGSNKDESNKDIINKDAIASQYTAPDNLDIEKAFREINNILNK